MESKVKQEKVPFPTKGILPKEETGATTFLTKYPDYDGRGVIVAIFDTGVDPGAPGLQVTSDGKPKIIDLVDCSGSGDVDTSTVREAVNGVLEGLSGRKLKLGKWDNPSGKYHVGVKPAFQLFPRGLTPRIKKERKETFDRKQREAVNALQREITEWKEGGVSKKDLESRLEILNGSTEDPGQTFDVVVFQDSKGVWRAVVDTKEEGDLVNAKPLANYKLEKQWSTLSEQDLLNYSINIYNDGNVCSIVTNAGAHGTHVAGIVGANFPKQPELNGIAPGAQIVSIKIGDNRLGSMETGASLVRALIAAKQNNCDLINISYGEPINQPNIGRFPELAKEFVEKHNIIILASAGNNGPCLSTVSSPGGTTSNIIGVGAVVTPSMMAVSHSIREELPETQYTWSSRGPTSDGALGVSISAPGGAIAPVPNWTLQKNQLMNGTSMASPNACGNVALILSGLKASGKKYSPHSIKRVIENTAKFDKGRDEFTQGYGLIQVEGAFEDAKKYSDLSDLRLDISINGDRGIYLRNVNDNVLKEFAVTVNPWFHKDYHNLEKVKLEKRVVLRSTASWVKAPEHLVINEARIFKITVDPLSLKEGEAYYAEVNLFDTECFNQGPIARVPISVIKPLVFEGECTKVYDNLVFSPGKIQRMFFQVPPGSNWVKTTIKAKNMDYKRLFVFQHCQTLQHQSLKTTMNEEYLWLETDTVFTDRFSVSQGTLEICLAQFWSSLGESGSLEFTVEFHGITDEAQGKSTQLSSSENYSVKVFSPLRSEKISPKAILAVIKKRISPSSSVLNPLHPDRDLLPEGRLIYSLINSYEFSLTESSTLLTRLVGFDTHLYDSPFESQFWMIFDENKQMVHSGDFVPEAVTLSKKGKYTVRVQFRHNNVEYLNQLKSFQLLLEIHLAKDKQLTLPVYSSMQDALVLGTKFPSKGKTLKKGDSTIVVVGPPPNSKLPKELENGDILSGYVSFRELEEGESIPDAVPSKGLIKPLGGILLEYVVTTLDKKPNAPPISFTIDEKKSPQENYEETVKQNAVNYLNFLIPKKMDYAKILLDELVKKYSNYLPLLSCNLTYNEKVAEEKKDYSGVVISADLLLSQIDTKELATFFGTIHSEEESEAVKQHTKTKELLLSTLKTKALALVKQYQIRPAQETKQEIINTANELNKWVKLAEETQYFEVFFAVEKVKGNLGSALKALKKQLDTSNNKKAAELMIEIFTELKWDHLVENRRSLLLVQHPPAYTLF